MIYGSLDTFDARQCGHAGVAAALEWARTHDVKALEPGRHEIDGDKLFLNLNEYETKPVDECKFEVHRRYIDVHVMVDGIERIDTQETSKCASGPFDEAGDFALLDGEAATQSILTNGTFAVHFPADAHKPGIAVGEPTHVKKGVFKILL